METHYPNNTLPSSNSEGSPGFAKEATTSAHGVVDRVLDGTAEVVHRTVDKVADTAALPGAWLAKQGETWQAAREKAVSTSRRYVGEHPWRSVGVAFGLGLLLGRWVR